MVVTDFNLNDNDENFLVISNNYIDYLIKRKKFSTFLIEHKGKYEITVDIKFKEIDDVDF